MARKNPVPRTEAEVGRRLRVVRERYHLAQTQFALLLEIGRERLASYEAGRVPLPFRIGERVCEQWGVNPFWLAAGAKPQMERHFFSIHDSTLRENRSFRDVVALAASPGPSARISKDRTSTAIGTSEVSGVVALVARDLRPWEIEEPENYFHPGVARVVVDSLELDPFVRKACVAHYGPVCQVCGIRFDKTYGKIGADFIEIHHLGPATDTRESFDPVGVAIPLCPNCHSMIHRRSPMLSVSELKRVFRR